MGRAAYIDKGKKMRHRDGTRTCDVCGDKIANAARSWPDAGGPGTPNVYKDGKRMRDAHLGCWRLLRVYG